jgi:N-methylhydantoinase A
VNRARVRLAVDVGGTFTDFVAASDTGDLTWTAKIPSDPRDPAATVRQGLEAAQALAPVSALHHGTTLATNAILEGRLARTALVTTRGFRDTLAIARMTRDHLYRLDSPPRPEPPLPRSHRLEVTERVLADGRVQIPLGTEEFDDLARQIRAVGVEAVAVCLLHSYANPEHEQRLGEYLRRHFEYVSLSHEVNAEFREYERSSTVIANASLMPRIDSYMDALEKVQRDGGVDILRLVQSNGGMMGVGTARGRPLSLVLSGPAAGVAATRSILDDVGVGDVVTLDMGGTSTDVALIASGQPAQIRQRRLGPFSVRLPSLAVESVGAGGGSIVWLDAAGALKVGPRSAGASPGPACYGLGGDEPTLTDAQLLLGFLPEGDATGTGIRLDRDLAAQALEPVARRLGMSPMDLAWGVCEVACAHMVRAIRLITIEKGHDPRDFALVAYGGGGPVHAGRVAQLLDMPHVIVPRLASVFSSYGCLVSDVRYEAARTFRARLDELSEDALLDEIRAIERDLSANLSADQVDPATVVTQRALGLRYAGQNEEIVVDLSNGSLSPPEIHRAFQRQHESHFHYATQEPVECLSLSVALTVPTTVSTTLRPLAREASTASLDRKVYLQGQGWQSLPVIPRAEIPVDRAIPGPCLIEDEMTTVVVYTGHHARRDEHDHLWMVARDGS